VMAVLVLAIIGLGLYPQPIFDQVAPGLAVLQHDGMPPATGPRQFAEGPR
jgi:NADH-quinone oxidoreductase subunit M